MNIGANEVIQGFPVCRVGNMNTEAAGVSVRREGETYHSRRREARENEQKACRYSLCESFDGEQVTIEQGVVYSINRSEHGILVLMGGRPRKGQLMELHVAERRWEYSLSLYEVQWTKRVPVEPHGELFLVGCRLVFEASRYWAF